MGHLGWQTNKQKPVLAHCKALGNCMQHSLMANLMANAYEVLSYDRQFSFLIFKQPNGLGMTSPTL